MAENKGTLKVRGSQSTRQGGRITLPRVIPLNTAVRVALCEMGYAQHRGTTALIFMGQRGPLTPRGARALFRNYAHKAGILGITLGTLRHTFCRNLVYVGADMASITALGGHPTLGAVRRYFELESQDLAKLVEMLPSMGTAEKKT